MSEPGRALNSYRLLGRSGLRVSPLALGAMTFGSDWGWGSDADEARRIFDAYVDRGGNFIDTAINYTNGTSERLLGSFMKEKRERLVIATKYTMMTRPGDPNSGGNHRLNMMRSVETSLRQMETDRIDLLYLHGWDFTTEPEEVMRGLDDLVRGGKVVYVAISNTPAWRIAQMQTLAGVRGWAPLVALQIDYNLVERTGEHDLIPMAAAMGLGVIPRSPLASGLLATAGSLSARKLAIAGTVREIAREISATAAQVALAWTLLNPTVMSPIIGARTPAQLDENLGALAVTLDDAMRERLDAASRPLPLFPYTVLHRPMSRSLVFGDLQIAGANR